MSEVDKTWQLCTTQAKTTASMSIKETPGCYCSTTHPTPLSPISGGREKKNQKGWMITGSSLPAVLWEWKAFSLSAALQMNIWPAGGRVGGGIKDKDINRGRGATRGQRGPCGAFEGHRRSFFFQSQQETKGGQEKDLSGLIRGNIHSLHTLHWKTQREVTEAT